MLLKQWYVVDALLYKFCLTNYLEHAYSLTLYVKHSQVKGIKGPSILSIHPRFDLVKGTAIDALHAICLGVTLQLLKLWFDKGNAHERFYIGDKVTPLHLVAWF